MHLALRLGRTLGELYESMDPHEFDLWMALYPRDPWDESRADLRAGVIASTVANYAGKMRSETIEPAAPQDFMPFIEREPEVETEPDPVSFFRTMT